MEVGISHEVTKCDEGQGGACLWILWIRIWFQGITDDFAGGGGFFADAWLGRDGNRIANMDIPSFSIHFDRNFSGECQGWFGRITLVSGTGEELEAVAFDDDSGVSGDDADEEILICTLGFFHLSRMLGIKSHDVAWGYIFGGWVKLSKVSATGAGVDTGAFNGKLGGWCTCADTNKTSTEDGDTRNGAGGVLIARGGDVEVAALGGECPMFEVCTGGEIRDCHSGTRTIDLEEPVWCRSTNTDIAVVLDGQKRGSAGGILKTEDGAGLEDTGGGIERETTIDAQAIPELGITSHFQVVGAEDIACIDGGALISDFSESGAGKAEKIEGGGEGGSW